MLTGVDLMDIIHATSRKRETYDVQLTYSPLWECALGIAAITNRSVIGTLEKPALYWDDLKETLSANLLQHLVYVEKNNTWKALLQVLHYKEMTNLSDFCSLVSSLDATELKYICLPFMGDHYQGLRQRAACGEEEAVAELKAHTSDHAFFAQYIAFIVKEDVAKLKKHLIEVMSEWYEAVIYPDLERTNKMLQTDVEAKKQAKMKMSPEEFVQWTTGGVNYLPEPSVHQVLLIPQYIYRPWNIEADIEGTKVFYYPIANQSLSPDDRYMPSHFLIQKYKALGDDARLRIVKLLSEGDASLQRITDQLEMKKTTVYHHLKTLRAAKMIDINHLTYSLNASSLELLTHELEQYINQ